MYERAFFGLTCVILLALFFLYFGQIRISKEERFSYQKIKECVSSPKKGLSPFIAEKVRIVSDDGELKFTKATIEKNIISCLVPRGCLEKENTSFEADTGQIICNAFQPQTIVLDGTVRFSSSMNPLLKEGECIGESFDPSPKNSDLNYPALKDRVSGDLMNHRYALADLVVIDFKENRASLSCIAPNRVLFQQDGIKMSAPQIWIENGEVKGLGDVRLFFEPKEIEQFEKTFANLIQKK